MFNTGSIPVSDSIPNYNYKVTGGNMVINWIASALSIIGIFFNAKKHIWCWPIWVISNILWIYISIKARDLPNFFLWTSFILFNFYGWRQWKNEKNEKNSNKMELK